MRSFGHLVDFAVLCMRSARMVQELRVHKVRGDQNMVDLMTKHLPRKKIDELMQLLGQTFAEGRADASLELQ